jgi:hypothetical protein
MIHGWILERLYFENETQFKPNGQTTVSGLPIGEIITINRKIVEAKAAAIGYAVGSITGATITAGGDLTIDVAGGGTAATITKLTGTGTNFALDSAEVTGVQDMILGVYNFQGKWISELKESVFGGWGGDGS